MKSRLESVQVGRPRELVDGLGRPWNSAFVKDPVTAPVFLDRVNLDGDQQGDLSVHGGPDKAVCVYSLDNYPYWADVLGQSLQPGSFGENFSISGTDEWEVCVGDVFRVGDAVVEVTQPRGPCWKLGRRWNRRDLPRMLQTSRRTGWYLRVLETGYLSSKDELVLVARPHPRWTIAELNRYRYDEIDDVETARQIAALPQLSGRWQSTFHRRVERGVEPDESARLFSNG